MFFIFNTDTNILENNNSLDLDLFLYDNSKVIRIATAGMTLINSLNDINFLKYRETFKKVLSYRRIFKFETNN